MKKIFTLILAAGLVSAASAQQSKQVTRVRETVKVKTSDRDYRTNRQTDFRTYSFTYQQKQAEINRIERQYGQKIAIIQRSRSARTAAMGRKVRNLEQQRDAEIRSVELKYDNQWNIAKTQVIVKNRRIR